MPSSNAQDLHGYYLILPQLSVAKWYIPDKGCNSDMYVRKIQAGINFWPGNIIM